MCNFTSTCVIKHFYIQIKQTCRGLKTKLGHLDVGPVGVNLYPGPPQWCIHAVAWNLNTVILDLSTMYVHNTFLYASLQCLTSHSHRLLKLSDNCNFLFWYLGSCHPSSSRKSYLFYYYSEVYRMTLSDHFFWHTYNGNKLKEIDHKGLEKILKYHLQQSV